jgi:hypothetical protein
MGPGVATAVGLGVAAGFNAWAALLVFGGVSRVFPGLLPGPVAASLASGPALTFALVLFLAEFLADKIPSLEHFWNLAHTLLRPAAGAVLALACVPGASPWAKAGLAALGGAVTFLAHLAKATSRMTSTAAVSGVSQMTLSLAEDVIAVCISAVAIFSPGLSVGVLVAVLVLMAILYSRVRHAFDVLFFAAAHPRKLLRAARERLSHEGKAP